MYFQTPPFLDHSLHHLHDIVIWIGKDGRIYNGNASALAFYGYSQDTFREMNIYDLDSNFGHTEWDQHWQALKRNGVLKVTVQHCNASGEFIPVEIVDTYQCMNENEYSVAVIRQIDHREDTSQRMQLMEFSVDQMVDSALWIDKDGCIIYANDASCRNLGYTHDELVKMAIYDIDPHFPKNKWPEHWLDLQKHKSLTFESAQRHKNGRLVPVEVNANLVQGYEQEFNCAFIHDITDRKAKEDALSFLANHDALTSLPNRNLLKVKTEQSIELAKHNKSNVGVLVIDLDNFKIINDGFGHSAGDGLLITMATRMQSVLRSCDTVSRLGGDEFVIVLDDMDDPKQCAKVCSKLQDVLVESVKVGDHYLTSTASIGVAIYPNDGEDFDTLIKHADIAMYRAKSSGRGNYTFYEEKMSREVVAQLEMITGLQRALKQNELVLLYQPIFDLQTDQLVGAEALLYWQDATGKLIPPGEFISVAEESGLILPIGEWVINEVCHQNTSWINDGMSAIPIAINLSGKQLYARDILQTVQHALSESQLPGEMLRIELTECTLMDNPQQAVDVLQQFHDVGLSLAIDNFGTGYCNLSYLHKYPVDVINIDLSFVKEIGESDFEPVIANTIIQLAHSMGCKVNAEGVETEQQRDYLRDQGCDYVQGFFYGNPVPAEMFESLFLSTD